MADPGFRRGVRLALDWGQARIGVAACDPDGTLCYPVETVPARPDPAVRLAALIAEYEPIEVIVGLPRTLAGGESHAAATVRAQVVQTLAPGVLVRFVDERLSTVTASRRLRGAGRDARRQRAIIDQAAAVAILEQALAVERSTGLPPAADEPD